MKRFILAALLAAISITPSFAAQGTIGLLHTAIERGVEGYQYCSFKTTQTFGATTTATCTTIAAVSVAGCIDQSPTLAGGGQGVAFGMHCAVDLQSAAPIAGTYYTCDVSVAGASGVAGQVNLQFCNGSGATQTPPAASVYTVDVSESAAR
jgi:hypothetical protein